MSTPVSLPYDNRTASPISILNKVMSSESELADAFKKTFRISLYTLEFSQSLVHQIHCVVPVYSTGIAILTE